MQAFQFKSSPQGELSYKGTKREDTTRGAIALSVLVMNINLMVKDYFYPKTIIDFSKNIYYIYLKIINDFGIQRNMEFLIA
jgi:hypothetical protein